MPLKAAVQDLHIDSIKIIGFGIPEEKGDEAVAETCSMVPNGGCQGDQEHDVQNVE